MINNMYHIKFKSEISIIIHTTDYMLWYTLCAIIRPISKIKMQVHLFINV
jgi:hypothetical protein